MSWQIETPVRVGPLIFSVISEVNITINSRGSGLAASGRKKPALILQVHAGDISGIDIRGHGYEADEIKTLYPGAIAQLGTMLDDPA